MDPIKILKDRLEGHPQLVHTDLQRGVRIDALDRTAFSVELVSDRDVWTVHLGNAGFHLAFTSDKEMLNFIAWCYSGAARLREFWRGSAPEKSILERYEDGEWHRVSETGFFLFPFWRERRTVILQNPNLLKAL